MEWENCSNPFPTVANLLCRPIFKLSLSFFFSNNWLQENPPEALGCEPLAHATSLCLLDILKSDLHIPLLTNDGLLVCTPDLMVVHEGQSINLDVIKNIFTRI